MMGRRLGGGPAFLIAEVAGTVSEVAVSGDVAAWIAQQRRIVLDPDEEAAPMSPRLRVRRSHPHPSESRDRLLLLLLIELWVAQRRRPRAHPLLDVAGLRDGVERRDGLLPARRYGAGAGVQGRHRHRGRAHALAPRAYRVATVAAALLAVVFAAVVAYQAFWVSSLR